MDHQVKDHVKFKSPILSRSNSGDVFEPSSSNAKQRATLVEWLNIILPDLNLPINASDEELRGYLVDGTILCRLIDKLKPNSVTQINGSTHSPHSRSENVKKYLSAVDEMGLPRFRASELEKGSMKIVVECLLTLQTHFTTSFGGSNGVDATKRWKPKGERLGREDLSRSLSFSSPNSEERRRVKLSDPKLHRSPTMAMADPSAALINHVGHKFHEVFQLKHVSYTDLSPGKLSEMMKSNSLDNAPTQSLLSVVNSILDESIERKNGEIPHRVACLLRKVVQEIERRISTQAEHLRTQNNLFKAREDKYQSRIRVLEALATGTGEETKQIVMDQLQHIKSEKSQIERKKVELLTSVLQSENKIEERKKVEPLSENNKIEERKKVGPLTSTPQSETNKIEEVKKVEPLTSTLQSENKKIEEREKLEPLTSTPQSENNELEERKKIEEKVAMKLMEEKENHNKEITTLKQELEIARKQYEQKCLEERKIVEPLTSTVQSENNEIEERKKIEEQIALKLINEKENHNKEIAALKEDLEIARKQYEQKCLEERKIVEPLTSTVQSENNEIEEKKKIEEQIALKLIQEKDNHDKEIAALKQELEIARKRYEQKCFEMETEYTGSNQELEQRLKDLGNLLAESRNKVKALEVSSESHSHLLTEERNRVKELEESTESTSNLLTESRNKVKALEASSESMSQQWNKKNQLYRKLTEFQLGALRELRAASQTIQQEIVGIQKKYSEDFGHLGTRMIALEEAAKQYYSLLAENQKLHNELQEVKGNIRVYCRVRPFLPGQSAKQTIVEYIGENGEIVVINPSKQGKEGRRSFKFNKVYGPTATQAEVFVDTQPLVQSVLDGFNVCIFAYGQTGSGKTYTMTGPDGATEKDWGVNYRALNDLFRISQLRKNTFKYEISVQMMEIYNEQVRDLLSNDGAPKKLGIVSAFQSNGLAVPEASIQPVNSPVDVLKLMDIGLKNRARSSTALNERSSRSHSIVTIHARAMDLKTGSSSRASLHLVDLAGSERVDRSEVTGDRLKEAQHINKSLAALGDVISALAQKSSHVPYRNSKLTQVLQSSLGGHAKTLMFVQLNPDISSCSESVSTLKFAERVSGVELGAAKSSKDGRDVRELMEQVASLKDTIAKKDEEIERLQLIKDQN